MKAPSHPLTVRAPQLSQSRRLTVYAIAGGVWLTGALWVLFHYFFTSEGPFGRTPHPLESWSLAAHGALAFASLWLFGLLWAIHIPAGWRTSRRRWTGGIIFGFVAWFVLTGFLLYYIGDDDWRGATILAHWISGLAAPIPFLLHRFQRETKGKKIP